PGNVGAIARVAEASGAVGIACAPGTAHANHPRALRASAGSLLRLPVAVDSDAMSVQQWLAPLRTRCVSLVAHGGCVLYEEPLDGTLVLPHGSEGAGLSQASRELADAEVRIPLAPPVESLNVATSAAVVLFERQRRSRASVAATDASAAC